MSEWPYYLCQACDRAAPTSRDLTWIGCEGKHEEVILKDLGQELYEALKECVENPDYWAAQDAAALMVARYEREILND